ncbi:MAG: glycosyltransferase [Lachnospiraceae bacterium]|nr:glycosyltransferase [Lachnospiraceae bacterium]
MGIVKELLRAPLERKYYTEYFYELEASYTSYDTFIRKWEEDYPASLCAGNDAKNRFSVTDYEEMKYDPDAEFVLFTSDTDKLDDRAYEVIAGFFDAHKDAKVVYGDEDEYNSDRTVRMNPFFKPDWSPDTLLDHFYMGNVVAFRGDVLKAKSGFDDIYELTLSVTKGMDAKATCHVNYVLFHDKYLKKLYKKGPVKDDYTDKGLNNKVSIIIPSKDNPAILGNCLRSVIKFTKNRRYEIIVVDNGSSEENQNRIKELFEGLKHDLATCGYVENEVDKEVLKYLYKPQPFNFSRMCNQGAAEADGDFLLFLNDDIEVREGRWLDKMMKVALRPHAGAVGAKLYYPNSMLIQHAGIVNLRLGPVHKLQFKDDDSVYYMDLNNGVHNCIAVTGACLLIDRKKFDDAGGFAEELEVAFNDVDLCFRLYKMGYHNATCNNTHLWHHESLSRGDDSDKTKLERLTGERELLYKRHPDLYARDPYYSEFMSKDILDTNYSFIYEYDYHNSTYDAMLKPFDGRIGDKWYNECLMTSVEYAGDLARFESIGAEEGSDFLISGYAYVAGSDNSQFERSLILKGEHNSYICHLPCVYRPDLEMNLDPEENALMCGFSVVIDMKELKKDDYRICILAKKRSSRLKLYEETNRFLEVV